MNSTRPEAAPQADILDFRHPWDKAAAGWNSHAAVIHEWLAEATAAMLAAARIGPGARVLDIAAQLNVFDTPIGWVGPNELLLCAAASPL